MPSTSLFKSIVLSRVTALVGMAGGLLLVGSVFALTPAPPRIMLSQGTPVSVGTRPSAVIASPDGQKAYVADAETEMITALDLSAKTIKKGRTSKAIGAGHALAISPDGKELYLPTTAGLTILDTITLETLRVLKYPSDISTPTSDLRTIARSYDGKTVYIALRDARAVIVFTLARGTVGQAVTLTGRPKAITAATSGAFVIDDADRVQSIIGTKATSSPRLQDVLSGTQVGESDLADLVALDLTGIAESKDGTTLWITATELPGRVIRLSALDLARGEVLDLADAVKPAITPSSIVSDPADGSVINIGGERNGKGEILAVDVRNGAVLSSQVDPRAGAPADLAFVPVGDRLLVANGKTGTITPYRIVREETEETGTVTTGSGTTGQDPAITPETTPQETPNISGTPTTNTGEVSKKGAASDQVGIAVVLVVLGGVGLVAIAVVVLLVGLKRRRKRVAEMPSTPGTPGNPTV